MAHCENQIVQQKVYLLLHNLLVHVFKKLDSFPELSIPHATLLILLLLEHGLFLLLLRIYPKLLLL